MLDTTTIITPPRSISFVRSVNIIVLILLKKLLILGVNGKEINLKETFLEF